MAKRKAGKRTASGRLSRAVSALAERNPPADHVLARRALFSFVTPTKGPDGRTGQIDQDICDGIGQLHAVGLLDGHGLDPKDMRDAARFYSDHFWTRYRETGIKTAKYERQDRSSSTHLGETADDRRFNRMDGVLVGYDREVLLSLVIDRGDDIVPWAAALIGEALREEFKRPVGGYPTMDDRARLAACIRALCAIVDGGMEMRRAA